MMLGKETNNQQKGKKTSGFQNRKEGQFSLGWDVNPQLNQFQTRKQEKDHGVTNKVGYGQNVAKQNVEISFQDKCREIIMNNPDITNQELQQLMAAWQYNKNQQEPISKVTRPSRPADSMKNVIFNQDPQQSNQNQRVSKRNQGTFSLGDGYNYFTDQKNQR